MCSLPLGQFPETVKGGVLMTFPNFGCCTSEKVSECLMLSLQKYFSSQLLFNYRYHTKRYYYVIIQWTRKHIRLHEMWEIIKRSH